jgi:hypothetical protein
LRVTTFDFRQILSRYFEPTADPATLDEHDQRYRKWLPAAMAFPARATSAMGCFWLNTLH